jgi:ABC-type antimicrobial peptide transport system permease subunit
MALGARRAAVLGSVLRESMALVVAGIAIGIAAAIGASYLVETLLFDLKPLDPKSFAIAVVIMAAVSALAGYLPARRASRVDPMVALRYE